MALTYEPIANVNVTSGINAITFNSIPSTYTDLRLIVHGKGSGNAGLYTVNNTGLSGTAYQAVNMASTPGVDSTRYVTYGYWLGAASLSWTSSDWMVTTIDFFGYASSRYKPALMQKWAANGGSTSTGVELWTWAYRNTSAITRIDLQMGTSGTWDVNTFATLYGIKGA